MIAGELWLQVIMAGLEANGNQKKKKEYDSETCRSVWTPTTRSAGAFILFFSCQVSEDIEGQF
jgi:hypothetical protein